MERLWPMWGSAPRTGGRNAGSYTVTATVFNWDHPAGVAFTLPVDVVPLTSPVLTSPRFAQQTFSLQFTGQPGLTYQYSAGYQLDRAYRLANSADHEQHGRNHNRNEPAGHWPIPLLQGAEPVKNRP